MFLLAKIFTISILLAVLSVDKTAAECCSSKYRVLHVCLGLPYEIDVPTYTNVQPDINRDTLYWVRNDADVKRPKCISNFCADGSYAAEFECGVGECNIFGCDCKGGCRQSIGLSDQEMAKIWREEHSFSFKSKLSSK